LDQLVTQHAPAFTRLTQITFVSKIVTRKNVAALARNPPLPAETSQAVGTGLVLSAILSMCRMTVQSSVDWPRVGTEIARETNGTFLVKAVAIIPVHCVYSVNTFS